MKISRYTVAAVLAAMALSGPMSAQAVTDKAGDTQMCVPLSQIDETPVIDDKTILIKMRGGTYKRMDLANRCSGLKMHQGFSHVTSTQDLCTTDTLRVIEPVGAVCMIDKIVNIDKDEAKALLARR